MGRVVTYVLSLCYKEGQCLLTNPWVFLQGHLIPEVPWSLDSLQPHRCHLRGQTMDKWDGQE